MSTTTTENMTPTTSAAIFGEIQSGPMSPLPPSCRDKVEPARPAWSAVRHTHGTPARYNPRSMQRTHTATTADPSPKEPTARPTTLEFMLRRPRLVESSVRAALTRSLSRKAAGADLLDARAFAHDVIETLSSAVEAERAPLDRLGRHELEGAALAAAARFLRSKLAERLAALPDERLYKGTGELDIVIADEKGRRHLVRLEAAATLADRIIVARAVAAALPGEAALQQPAVHLFSLRDGKLRSFALGAHAAHIPHAAQAAHVTQRAKRMSPATAKVATS